MDSATSPKRIVFLFGAGVSIPAGMPSTAEITDCVLSGDGVMRHSDCNYYFGKPLYEHMGWPDEYVPILKNITQLLKSEIELYSSNINDKEINYEDIFYVASQVNDKELGEFDNPAVQPFLDLLYPKIMKIINDDKFLPDSSRKPIEILHEEINYITCIVWQILRKRSKQTGYLKWILDAIEEPINSKIDIFTLNHDLIFESLLSDQEIDYVDGFGPPVKDVKYWNPKLFENSMVDVRLFKLHGSINWFRFGSENSDIYSDRYGQPLISDFWHTHDSGGTFQYPLGGKPFFLLGTFNKIMEYTKDMYLILYYYFNQVLSGINSLVICGYGFGDKGINNAILEWLYSARGNKIIVIHPSPEELRNSARPAFELKWDELKINNKLVLISKRAEDVEWKDIKTIL